MSSSTALRVLIPAGDSPFAMQVAQCLKRGSKGMRVDATYVDKRALSRYSRYVDRTFHIPSDAILEGLEDVLKKGDYDVLLPVSGPGISLVSAHVARLSHLVRPAAVPRPEQLDMVNDKWLFYQCIVDSGIATPHTILVDSPNCAAAFEPDSPVLLKPRSGSGGLGIVRFDRASDFKDRADPFLGEGHPYIMQSFIVGHDIDRSVLCLDGKVIASTIQEGVSTKHGYAPSGALHFHHDPAVAELVDRMMAELGWNGIAHVDLRYSVEDGMPHVIEINPRYWSTVMGSLVAGVNFPLVQVLSAMGEQLIPVDFRDCHYVSFREWPGALVRLGVPLGRSSLVHALADPIAKLLKRFRPSTALGGDRA